MVPVADDEGGPDMVSFRELARRLVAEHIVKSMSHQRVSQLHREDPNFPPVITVGRSKVVDWKHALPYFQDRKPRQGRRTDLESK
jgi:proteasome assembly chaperone (PAC2) family protein